MTVPIQPAALMLPDEFNAMVPTPPELLGSGQNAAGLPVETMGLTPEAAQEAAEAMQRLQLEQEDKRRKALRAMFGDDFPMAKDPGVPASDQDWERWSSNRWDNHRAGVSQNILWAERNRLFRAGKQNLSPYGTNGVWRPAPQPKEAVKIIDNRVRPALAWALEVMAEQRPGFRFQPMNTDADRQEKAQAQQRAVEYQWNALDMHSVLQEVGYWAQTDGVAFTMTYWDPDKGPWEELETQRGPVPLGDVGIRCYRIEQVRVSAEATATVRPMYWIVREIMPKQQAVALYGPEIVEQSNNQLLAQQVTQLSSVNQYAYNALLQDQPTIARFTVFCDKSQWLPEGLTVVVVGHKVVYGPKKLLMGRVPMARWTDGSEDPAFYPVPKMNGIVGPQMRLNQLWSKWYESIRKNSGGRYATKTGAVSAETLIGGEVSMLEVRTAGDIRESILPVAGFSVGNDIKEALDREIAIIEEQTGYTKEARGQFTSDQSGKAILAIREQLERSFAPFVMAIAKGSTEVAKQFIGWMRFGYQLPRNVAVMGKDRMDLAIELSAVSLDGAVDVSVDPETLVPQPKALKQWMLDNAYDRQIITKEQWLERSPIGDVQDMESPSKVQYDKAKRIVEQIKIGQPPEPMVWQDDESIQQGVLEKDIILAGGSDPQQMALAMQRWQELATQHSQKMAPPPVPGTPEGDYAILKQKILAQTEAAIEAVISKAIQAADMASAGAAAAGAVGAPAPSEPSGAPSGNGKKPPKGSPPDSHVTPLFSGATPSVSAAPAVGAGIP